jgi:hypothetical protein
MLGVYKIGGDNLFITRNFSTGGAGVLVAPIPQAAIGDGFGLVLTAGVWFVDTGAATNIGRIVRVLDANRRDVGTPSSFHKLPWPSRFCSRVGIGIEPTFDKRQMHEVARKVEFGKDVFNQRSIAIETEKPLLESVPN